MFSCIFLFINILFNFWEFMLSHNKLVIHYIYLQRLKKNLKRIALFRSIVCKLASLKTQQFFGMLNLSKQKSSLSSHPQLIIVYEIIGNRPKFPGQRLFCFYYTLEFRSVILCCYILEFLNCHLILAFKMSK